MFVFFIFFSQIPSVSNSLGLGLPPHHISPLQSLQASLHAQQACYVFLTFPTFSTIF